MSELDVEVDKHVMFANRARYEGIELDAETDQAVIDALRSTDIAVSSIGLGFRNLEKDIERAVEAGETYDTDDVVIFWRSEEHFRSRDTVQELAHELDRIAELLADEGLTLHYHNHDHEFSVIDGETGGPDGNGIWALEALAEETDHLRFEVDLGWAGVGGADPVGILERLGKRVTHIHAKDMDFSSGEFTTFGEGDLDIETTVRTARNSGVEWLLFENDDPIDPIAEPMHASLFLDRYTNHLS